MESGPAASGARIAARVTVGVAGALAAVVVVVPLVALLGFFGPMWSAAIWALGLVVAFAGWGTFLHRRLAPALDADLGLRAAWGLSLTVAAGGLLCLVGLARRPMLLAWRCTVFSLRTSSAAIARSDLPAVINRRTSTSRRLSPQETSIR